MSGMALILSLGEIGYGWNADCLFLEVKMIEL